MNVKVSLKRNLDELEPTSVLREGEASGNYYM